MVDPDKVDTIPRRFRTSFQIQLLFHPRSEYRNYNRSRWIENLSAIS